MADAVVGLQYAFPKVLDNTMVKAWRACPKKFWWHYQRNLHPTDASVHLVAGGAFAKGLEVVRKRYFDDSIPFHDAVALGGIALLTEYGDFKPNRIHERKDALNVLGAMGKYFVEWPIDTGIVPYLPPGSDKHAIEYSFAAPVPGVRHPETGDFIVYSGRFDFIGCYQGDTIIGVDDKTASQLGQSWLAQWVLPNQLLGYTWGAAQNGLKLGGFEVRGTSLLANGYGHLSDTRMFPRWKIDAFERELTSAVTDMIRDWERNVWRMDLGSSCSAYSGCPFLVLCDTPFPEDWIAVNFEERVWNPLASRD